MIVTEICDGHVDFEAGLVGRYRDRRWAHRATRRDGDMIFAQKAPLAGSCSAMIRPVAQRYRTTSLFGADPGRMSSSRYYSYFYLLRVPRLRERYAGRFDRGRPYVSLNISVNSSIELPSTASELSARSPQSSRPTTISSRTTTAGSSSWRRWPSASTASGSSTSAIQDTRMSRWWIRTLGPIPEGWDAFASDLVGHNTVTQYRATADPIGPRTPVEDRT